MKFLLFPISLLVWIFTIAVIGVIGLMIMNILQTMSFQ